MKAIKNRMAEQVEQANNEQLMNYVAKIKDLVTGRCERIILSTIQRRQLNCYVAMSLVTIS